MRVALLSHNARAGDAIGNQLAEKVAFFRDRGADVRLFVEDATQLHAALVEHAETYCEDKTHSATWRFLSTADLVIVEYGQHYRLLSLLSLLAGGKPRILFDYHGVTPPELWTGHNREALERGAGQRGLAWFADAVIVHSQFTGRELTVPTGLPSDRLRVLGHVIDTEHFCPGLPAHDFRGELGLAEAILLLFVGRVAPNKRLPVLIDALARLRERTPPVHAIVVGDTSDLYQAEAERCRRRAAELGVADRLHFLGKLDDKKLRDAYRAADLFVMPSRHEGFCIPAVEAMACGLPVLAARAGALPETVGDAGLTFHPDDADDLARQIQRGVWGERGGVSAPCLTHKALTPPHAPAFRVAVVCYRYGSDIVGGAEASLRTAALALTRAGHHVEVFTTCTKTEGTWTHDRPAGTTTEDGIPLHRHALDAHDRPRHLESFRVILEGQGRVSPEAEHEYLVHSVHSRQLTAALRQRLDEFDALIVGPYLFGVTHDVACAFPDKTLLVPCFHDEPLARLRLWVDAYERVGGVLYHSPEEQAFAERELGLTHPGAAGMGTFLDTETRGDATRGRRAVGTGRRYLVYCGRYSAHKNLPLLLDYARRYSAVHPDRFTFAFLGRRELTIPNEPWARDLGFMDEAGKRDVLAGAAAMVQLSCFESLSIAALEAWAQGVPLIAHEACAVLAGQIRRAQGGRAVGSYEAFAAALDDLWQEPRRWQGHGESGRAYTHANYGSLADYTRRLEAAVRDLQIPLAERMRRRGLARAAGHHRALWRERFGQLVEDVLHASARPMQERIEIHPRGEARTAAAGSTTVLVPVRVVNRGTHPAVSEGPARLLLRGCVANEVGSETPLPGLLLPGQSLAAAVPVPVPAACGEYRVGVRSCRANHPDEVLAEGTIQLTVRDGVETTLPCCTPQLDALQAALAEAERRARLPDDYTDVTEGILAEWKRWAKQKLLNNFKRAYVDVLSRQQSAFNQQVLVALQELAECCVLLDQARAGDADLSGLVQRLQDELDASRKREALLTDRIARLEQCLSLRARA